MDQAVKDALITADVPARFDAPLLKRTWWRTGGNADVLIDCPDLDTLCTVRRIATEHDVPLFVLGNASNLLVADAGIRGIVVRLTKQLAQIEPEPGALLLGGGVKMMMLVSRMMKNGWAGLEFMAGIPGTVGGAVRMNAGTHLGEVVDGLVEVQLVLADGSVEWRSAESLKLTYRHSELPEGSIVAAARFRLTDDDPEASRATIQAHLDRRAATQPVDRPTCGSTFRNPPGDHAGRLIEACGLKGFTIGKAKVSEKHANFIENTGGATAADIRAVVEHVRDTVAAETGVTLVQEVHFVGDW